MLVYILIVNGKLENVSSNKEQILRDAWKFFHRCYDCFDIKQFYHPKMTMDEMYKCFCEDVEMGIFPKVNVSEWLIK